MDFWFFFFFSSRRRHTRWNCDWSSDVCSSDLAQDVQGQVMRTRLQLSARIALALGITGSVVGLSIGPAGAAVSTLSVNPGTSITANTTVTVSASSAKTG